MGKQWKQRPTLFWGLHNHCRWWLQPWNWKMLAPWKKTYDEPRQHIKKQRHYFANKGPSPQSYGFFSSHVWMWELDYKERWVPKNWYFWTVVLEETLESPLDSKEIQPVHPKGDQSWIFSRRTDAKAETPIIWPPDVKNWLICKALMLGRIEGRRRRGRQRMRWLDGITTWVWVNSGNWWWTGSPGVLQSMGSQRVRQEWETELNWNLLQFLSRILCFLLMYLQFSNKPWESPKSVLYNCDISHFINDGNKFFWKTI